MKKWFAEYWMGVLIMGMVIVLAILAVTIHHYQDKKTTVNTGELCARAPKFIQVSSAANRVGLVIVALDVDGRVWVKVNDGCWSEQ